jgi:hypothetical protein
MVTKAFLRAKVSVTILDNWGNGGPEFTRSLPFDKLTAVRGEPEMRG